VDDHPVWQAYDLLRTTRMNAGYYSAKSDSAKIRTRVYEIVLAIVAPGSAVAVLTFWNEPHGSAVWGVLATIASLMAVAKPFLKMEEQLQSYQSCATEFRSLASELEALRSEIAEDEDYGERHREWLRHIRNRATRLADIEPVETIDETLRSRMFERVSKEIPADSLFVPEDNL